MMDAFEPIMQPDNVAETARYYDDVFVPLGKVVPAMSADNVSKFQGYLGGLSGVGDDAAKLTAAFGAQYQMTPEQVQAMMGQAYPSMSQMLGNLPQMPRDFDGLLSMMPTSPTSTPCRPSAGSRGSSSCPACCFWDWQEWGCSTSIA